MALMSKVVKGNIIHIHDFSRLARSTTDLLSIVETLNCKGVTLVSNKESIDTSTPTGKLMLTMIGAINEFERTNLLERQAEGIAAARRGIIGGRLYEIYIAGNLINDTGRSSGYWGYRIFYSRIKSTINESKQRAIEHQS